MAPDTGDRALKSIAVYEAAKGVAAVLGAFGLLSLMHHDLHRLALELIGHFGLQPHQHYPELLLQAVDKLNATPLRTLTLAALAYAGVRWIEAWGLWHDRAWGEWFGAASGAVYLPFEVQHMRHHLTWPGVLVFTVNGVLVAYLLLRLWQRRRGRFNARVSPPPLR